MQIHKTVYRYMIVISKQSTYYIPIDLKQTMLNFSHRMFVLVFPTALRMKCSYFPQQSHKIMFVIKH